MALILMFMFLVVVFNFDLTPFIPLDLTPFIPLLAPTPFSIDPKLTANTVVKNTLSGEFGVVSGNLLLVLRNDAALEQLQARFNLTLVSNTAGSKLVLVKAQDNTDLKTLLTDIKASGLVKSIKLDILEKRYHSR